MNTVRSTNTDMRTGAEYFYWQTSTETPSETQAKMDDSIESVLGE
jgi:hypothetical protein